MRVNADDRGESRIAGLAASRSVFALRVAKDEMRRRGEVPSRTPRRLHALVALLVLGAASCGLPYSEAEDSGGESADAGGVADAFAPGDAALGAEADASDGAVDSPIDAGCLCQSTSECEVAVCVNGACELTPIADGTPCASGVELCVEGACVLRGCGDGYREGGPKPAREACDDGNASVADACSPACAPTTFVVASSADGREAPAGPHGSIGIDGRGGALLVWHYQDSTGIEIRARRFTASGVPQDSRTAPLIVSGRIGLGVIFRVSVAGLAGGGWVVVWDPIDGDGDARGIVFRIIQPDGSMTPPYVASEIRYLEQRDPSVAAFGDGFVIAWADGSCASGTGPILRIAARRFDRYGVPITREELVSSQPSLEQRDPVVAASGTTYLVAWHDLSPAEGSALRMRRFDTASAVDTTDQIVAPSRTAEVAVSTLASGDFVAVWRDGSRDPYGDIVGRRIAASGEPFLEVAEPLTASPEPFGVLTADIRPSVAALTGSDYLVTYSRYRNERGLGLSSNTGATLPPEIELLQNELLDTSAGDGALASGPSGLWAAWSTASDPEGVGAWRSALAIFLAVE